MMFPDPGRRLGMMGSLCRPRQRTSLYGRQHKAAKQQTARVHETAGERRHFPVLNIVLMWHSYRAQKNLRISMLQYHNEKIPAPPVGAQAFPSRHLLSRSYN